MTIQEFKNQYGELGDALIQNINYNLYNLTLVLKIETIRESIELHLINVHEFLFKEMEFKHQLFQQNNNSNNI